MDINTQNSSGMMNQMPPSNMTGMNPNGQKPEKKVGPIIGTLIIVLVLIIAALYFLGPKLSGQSSPATDTTSMNSSESQQAATATDSEATDPATIKADLDNQLKNVDYSF